jgi:ketosteroid isomerase-like protein
MPDALQRVLDELEIRNLLARLAQLSDSGTLEEYLDCMHEDAVWGGTGFPARRGHQEILEGATQRRADAIAGPGTHTRHLISTSYVEVTGETANARSIFSFYGNTHQTPELNMMGVWEDEFRRTDRGWKLARRTIVREED